MEIETNIMSLDVRDYYELEDLNKIDAGFSIKTDNYNDDNEAVKFIISPDIIDRNTQDTRIFIEMTKEDALFFAKALIALIETSKE